MFNFLYAHLLCKSITAKAFPFESASIIYFATLMIISDIIYIKLII